MNRKAFSVGLIPYVIGCLATDAMVAVVTHRPIVSFVAALGGPALAVFAAHVLLRD